MEHERVPLPGRHWLEWYECQQNAAAPKPLPRYSANESETANGCCELDSTARSGCTWIGGCNVHGRQCEWPGWFKQQQPAGHGNGSPGTTLASSVSGSVATVYARKRRRWDHRWRSKRRCTVAIAAGVPFDGDPADGRRQPKQQSERQWEQHQHDDAQLCSVAKPCSTESFSRTDVKSSSSAATAGSSSDRWRRRAWWGWPSGQLRTRTDPSIGQNARRWQWRRRRRRRQLRCGWWKQRKRKRRNDV